MSKRHAREPNASRRRVLIAAGAAVSAPWIARFANGQAAELAAYESAKVNWRAVDGESISVAVIPASYFDNLIAVAPQFEALTGVKVRFDKVLVKRCYQGRNTM